MFFNFNEFGNIFYTNLYFNSKEEFSYKLVNTKKYRLYRSLRRSDDIFLRFLITNFSR